MSASESATSILLSVQSVDVTFEPHIAPTSSFTSVNLTFTKSTADPSIIFLFVLRAAASNGASPVKKAPPPSTLFKFTLSQGNLKRVFKSPPSSDSCYSWGFSLAVANGLLRISSRAKGGDEELYTLLSGILEANGKDKIVASSTTTSPPKLVNHMKPKERVLNLLDDDFVNGNIAPLKLNQAANSRKLKSLLASSSSPSANNNKKQRTFDMPRLHNYTVDRDFTPFRPYAPINSRRSKGGLSNLGNSCYMNAALQALFALPSFKRVLAERKKSGSELAKLLSNLSHQLIQAAPEENLSALSIKRYISKINPQFGGYDQQDSQEFLSALLAELALSKEDTTFNVQIDQRVKCKRCFKMSRSLQAHRELSLSVQGHEGKQIVQVEDLLHQFFTDEHLDDYQCSGCCSDPSVKGERVQADIQKLLCKPLPRILILHLKRFQFDMTGRCTRKSSQPIDVFGARHIDLSLFTNRKWQNNRSMLSTGEKENVPPPASPSSSVPACTKYTLRSIVNHLGNNLSHGHYVADVCDEEKSNCWYLCDDSIKELHLEEGNGNGNDELDFFGLKRQSTAYLLFYELGEK